MNALKTDTSGNPITPLNLSGSNVVGTLSSDHLNVGTTLGTVASGNDARLVAVSVLGNRAVALASYNPTLDGSVNVSPALDQAIAAQAANGGSILIPPGAKPRFNSSHNVPEGVYLEGGNGGPRFRTLAPIGQAQETLNTGTVLQLTAGAGGAYTTQAQLTFARGSGIKNVSVMQPQSTTGAAVTLYPPALRFADFDCWLENVESINVLHLLDVQGGRCRVRGITGQTLGICVNVDGALDWTEISDIRISPTWSGFSTATQYPAAYAYYAANGIILKLGRADNILVDAISCYGSNTGLLLQPTGSGAAYGTLSRLNFDLTTTCVQNNGTGPQALEITDSILIGAQYGYNCTPNTISGVVRFLNNLVSGYGSDFVTPLMNVVGAIDIRGNTFLNAGSVTPQKAISVTGSSSAIIQGNTIQANAAGVITFDGANAHGYALGNRCFPQGAEATAAALNSSDAIIGASGGSALQVSGVKPALQLVDITNPTGKRNFLMQQDAFGNIYVSRQSDDFTAATNLFMFPATGGISFAPQTAASVTTPPSGYNTFYSNSTDGRLHWKDSGGGDHALPL